MMILITGGSGSGKSVYGEERLQGAEASHRYYLATMRPWGEEGARRVARHRQQREGKGFETIEIYHHLGDICLENIGPDVAVLLECMSNLTANEQFEVGGSDEEILERIRKGLRRLRNCVGTVIVVTNEVFSDTGSYEKETLRYRRLLGQMNQELASAADEVVEVVFGIPVLIKSAERGITEKSRKKTGKCIKTCQSERRFL